MTETAIFKYACNIYEYMEEHSELSEYEERIYVGSFLEVFNRVGASTRYYTAIRQLLDSPDLDPCVTFQQRGNIGQPSIIVLNHPPPAEWGAISHKDLTRPRERAILGAELERRIAQLEAWRETLGEVNIAEALENHERRLLRLEREENGKAQKKK